MTTFIEAWLRQWIAAIEEQRYWCEAWLKALEGE